MKQLETSSASSKRVEKIFVGIAIILPPILTFCYVYKFGITIPYWDQWDLVPELENIRYNTLTVTGLWRHHNEHRIIFPQIVMLFLAYLSNWNIFLELCTNILLAIFTLSFLLSLLNSTLEKVPPWLKIFTSLMIFSMVQQENWRWGWQLVIFMSVLGTVAAIWAANKWQGKTIGLVIVISAAVLSSYSFNAGLITWPAVFVVFLLSKKWKQKHIIILTLACIATVGLYYYKYTRPASLPSLLFFMSDPLNYAKYVFTYLGVSLGCWHPSACLAVTLISLVIISSAIFNLWRFDRQKLCDLSPWLALSLYACMAACATGLGRAGYGLQQASLSRYTTISLFLPLSAAVMMIYSIKSYLPKKRDRLIKGSLFAIIMLLFAVSYIKSYRLGIGRMEYLKTRTHSAMLFCLTNPQSASDDLLKIILYPDPNTVRLRIKTLSELGIKFKTDD